MGIVETIGFEPVSYRFIKNATPTGLVLIPVDDGNVMATINDERIFDYIRMKIEVCFAFKTKSAAKRFRRTIAKIHEAHTGEIAGLYSATLQ